MAPLHPLLQQWKRLLMPHLSTGNAMMEISMFPQWEELAEKFRDYHRNPANVWLHLITTPLGIYAAFCLLNKATNTTGVSAALACAYIISLLTRLPVDLVLCVCVMVFALVGLTEKVKLGWGMSLLVLAVSFVGQELAHRVTGEPTYMGSYTVGSGNSSLPNAQDWVDLFSEHTYYLLPLVLDVVEADKHVPRSLPQPDQSELSRLQGLLWVLVPFMFLCFGNFKIDSDAGWLPLFVQRKRLLMCNLGSKELRGSLSAIRKWTTDRKPSKETTTHHWYTDLEGAAREGFDAVALSKEMDSMFRAKFDSNYYAMDVLTNMNEVLVSGPVKQGTSDTVFFTKHIDGPLGLFPFCSVFRCIVGCDSAGLYTTHFNSCYDEKQVLTGDVLAFDFNREIHYISPAPGAAANVAKLPADQGGDGFRIVLKIHYCVYPRAYVVLGKLLGTLNTLYNMLFRRLFLATIRPSDPFSAALAQVGVVGGTIAYNFLWEHIGPANLVYVALMAFLGWAVDYRIFLVGTSFVHYFRYIGTYFSRADVDFGVFKRDALFFKAVTLVHLAVLYGRATLSSALDPVSIALAAAGYGISMAATGALGIDRTYFGSELGHYGYNRVSGFPYGTIPHPMIIGQVLALAGLQKQAAFRAAWPWLAPAHAALYLLHCLQEHLDIFGSKGNGRRVEDLTYMQPQKSKIA
jgi:hypothetical protein